MYFSLTYFLQGQPISFEMATQVLIKQDDSGENKFKSKLVFLNIQYITLNILVGLALAFLHIIYPASQRIYLDAWRLQFELLPPRSPWMSGSGKLGVYCSYKIKRWLFQSTVMLLNVDKPLIAYVSCPVGSEFSHKNEKQYEKIFTFFEVYILVDKDIKITLFIILFHFQPKSDACMILPIF